jgi:hypothetical protein
MTTPLTEGKHRGEFIVSEAEASGFRSRSTGTVLSGEVLVAGQIVEADGSGKLKALSGLLNTGLGLITEAAGIMYDNVDASAGDATGAVFIARDAEVNGAELTYPTESTAGGEAAATNASLALLGIIVR